MMYKSQKQEKRSFAYQPNLGKRANVCRNLGAVVPSKKTCKTNKKSSSKYTQNPLIDTRKLGAVTRSTVYSTLKATFFYALFLTKTDYAPNTTFIKHRKVSVTWKSYAWNTFAIYFFVVVLVLLDPILDSNVRWKRSQWNSRFIEVNECYYVEVEEHEDWVKFG